MSDITIRPFTPEDAPRVAQIYCNCFAENPWFELFEPAEVITEFNDMNTWANCIILVAERDGVVIGGTVGYPFSRRDDIAPLLPEPVDNAFYYAELFVDGAFRNNGVATKLVLEREEYVRQMGYENAVVRTSTDQPIILEIYYPRGFKLVAEQDVISTKVINGVEQQIPDKRVILVGKI